MIKYTTENLELAFAEYGKKKSFTDWSTKITYIYRWLNEKLKKNLSVLLNYEEKI